MSSREIAELCDKEHRNVLADIRTMLNELGLYAPDFSGTYAEILKILTLSMANFHSPKLGSAILLWTKTLLRFLKI